MSVMEMTEKDLRLRLAKELDKLDREQLLITHQFVSRIIAEALINAVTQDWEIGKVNRAAIQKAIDEYRARNPYGATES
ncbi:MAG: hypothetical protein ONB44_07235 [candidate division KSB1 bacterium]|nr:hypothetical protein [candidate division KSB1 bacterium]MDZ7301919.1 hypothetical protein [candidate division KSB1 bacterium]MDZ7314250.1 hypothetical protein [candidate division KSB1 bacterium]